MHSNETFTYFNGPCRLLHCQISLWFSHQSHCRCLSNPSPHFATHRQSPCILLWLQQCIICLDCHTRSLPMNCITKDFWAIDNKYFERCSSWRVHARINWNNTKKHATKTINWTFLSLFFGYNCHFSVSYAKNTKKKYRILTCIHNKLLFAIMRPIFCYIMWCMFCLCLFSANCSLWKQTRKKKKTKNPPPHKKEAQPSSSRHNSWRYNFISSGVLKDNYLEKRKKIKCACRKRDDSFWELIWQIILRQNEAKTFILVC